MIIDAHTHRYPEEVHADPAKWANENGEHHWAQLVAPQAGRLSLQGFVTGDAMLRDMDAAGIDRSIMLGWYWQHQKTCNWHNAWMARWLKEHPDRFGAFASVNAAAGESAYNAVRSAIEVDGFCGIGEMLPTIQGFQRDNETWLKILSWAEQHGVPVNFHVTEPLGPEYPGSTPTPFNDFLYYAENFPRLKMILAHWGGGMPFYKLRRKLGNCFDNVYFDTAASPLIYEPDYISNCIAAAGADKVLFGTDYPLRIYPKLSPGDGAAKFLKKMQNIELEANNLKQVLGANANKILG